MKSFLIGSLPFKNTKDALKFINEFSLPTLCTLPQLEAKEFMLNHSFEGLASFEYKRNRVRKLDKSQGIKPFQFMLENEFFRQDLSEYKWQCSGPVSMIETMEAHENDSQLLSEYTQKIILTQEKFNQLTSAKSYFFLDEPMLGTAPKMESILIKFIQELKANECFKNTSFGIHSCSKLEFDLTSLPVELIALDYQLYQEDEWSKLQQSLNERLVAITKDSNLNVLNYPLKNEKYQSTSCGQALYKGDLLALIQDHQD